MTAPRALTQAAADSLLSMHKYRTDDTVHPFPDLGGRLSVALMSADRTESFLLDVSRGRLNLRKQKFQSRARKDHRACEAGHRWASA